MKKNGTRRVQCSFCGWVGYRYVSLAHCPKCQCATVRFIERPAATDTLSRAATAIVQLSKSHAEAAHYDAGFDGGEWSGPAHDDMEAEEQNDIAQFYRFANAAALFAAIKARTTARWMHFCFPGLMEHEYEPLINRKANQ